MVGEPMTIDEMLKQTAELTESEMQRMITRVIINLRDKGHADVDDLSESFSIIRYERFKRADAWIDQQKYKHGLMPRLPMGEGR